MADLLTTLHPINDNNTDLYPNVKNENIPPVISGKDAMEALEGDFSTLKTDELQIGGENGTLINKDQIVTQNKVINLDEIVDDAELAQGLNGKVDKVSGKGLSTNDYTNADKALVDTIPDKVNKEQGKGLSTNDFTNEYKKDLDQDIPEQIQLFKDAFEDVGTALNGKVDKVSGKGLSTNDYTNADKDLVDTIPDKVDKVQGKGLSTNDYTNADKSYLDNLPNYFISIASGGVVNLANPPATGSTNYFGAKHGTTSNFLLSDTHIQAKVTGNTGETWNFLMYGNTNSVPMFTHIIPASGDNPSQIRQYKLPSDVATGSHELALRDDLTEVQYIVGEHAIVDGKIYRFQNILFLRLDISFYEATDDGEVLITIPLPFEEGSISFLIVDYEGGNMTKLIEKDFSNSRLELLVGDLRIGESSDTYLQGSSVIDVHPLNQQE